MRSPTLTEMKVESEYLRDRPAEMKRELYWMYGIGVPLEDQIPDDALEEITAESPRNEGEDERK